MARIRSDQWAVDAIATLLGTAEEWSSAADFLDEIASIVGQTGRPSVGDVADVYALQFRLSTGRDVIPAYDGTPEPPEDDDEDDEDDWFPGASR